MNKYDATSDLTGAAAYPSPMAITGFTECPITSLFLPITNLKMACFSPSLSHGPPEMGLKGSNSLSPALFTPLINILSNILSCEHVNAPLGPRVHISQHAKRLMAACCGEVLFHVPIGAAGHQGPILPAWQCIQNVFIQIESVLVNTEKRSLGATKY